MTESVLLVEKSDRIATLTLNRPERMNALSLEMSRLFRDAVDDIRLDSNIGVVILTGAGRAFCAGLDLKEMGDAEFRAHEKPVTDPATLLRSLR